MGKLNNDWKEHLGEEFDKPYFLKIKGFLREESKKGKVIYPKSDDVFAGFNNCPFDKVKVVIVGQDPYINEGEAMGMCFSVPKTCKVPPSLVNIFKEIETETGIKNTSGDLTSWASQGVLLINSLLTVEKGKPLSHSLIGWQNFFEATIKMLNEKKEKLIFVLWGRNAGRAENLINKDKHYVLTSSHPSPLGAYSGFFGCGHFNEINRILKENKREEINWSTK